MRKEPLPYWLAVYLALQAGDLVTTWLAGISCEGNPYMVRLWTHCGFWALVVGKTLLVPMMAFLWHLIGTMPLSSCVHKMFRAILAGEALVPMVAVVLWNSYWLLT